MLDRRDRAAAGLSERLRLKAADMRGPTSSPLYALLLDAAAADVDAGGVALEILRPHAGEPPESAWQAFRDVLEAHPEEVGAALARPCQTNEAGRCAALLPGFLAIAREHGPAHRRARWIAARAETIHAHRAGRRALQAGWRPVEDRRAGGRPPRSCSPPPRCWRGSAGATSRTATRRP